MRARAAAARPAGRYRKVVAGLLRVAAGPLALAGFFLPWADGPGPLAATEFSGCSLVGFAGRLEALDLAPGAAALVWAVRLAVLLVAVTAAWMTVLGPVLPRHAAYRASGWYLAASVALLLALGLWRSGVVVPAPGLALLAAGAGCYLAQVRRPQVGRIRRTNRATERPGRLRATACRG